MSKTTQCEDVEVQAIIEAGTQSVEWVQQEFARADLRDKRLDRRLIKTAQQLATSPISPINEACGDWASTQAAYRLFDNPKASPQAILAPHIEETAKRMAAQSAPVLVSRTRCSSLTASIRRRGPGADRQEQWPHERGLIMHNALAFTASGVPLGLSVR